MEKYMNDLIIIGGGGGRRAAGGAGRGGLRCGQPQGSPHQRGPDRLSGEVRLGGLPA